MTHSLHRRGDRESLKEDFVVICCPSTGINKKGAAAKMREFLRICYKHGPVNLGDVKTGNIYNTTMEDILDLKELKERNPGISVVVSGVPDIVQGIMDEAGLGRIHTIEYSMGTWGRPRGYPISRY